jgi:hypothetical protein
VHHDAPALNHKHTRSNRKSATQLNAGNPSANSTLKQGQQAVNQMVLRNVNQPKCMGESMLCMKMHVSKKTSDGMASAVPFRAAGNQQ